MPIRPASLMAHGGNGSLNGTPKCRRTNSRINRNAMQELKGLNVLAPLPLLIVVAIIGIIAAIAIPNLLASRRAANEGSAIASVRSLNTPEATYFATSGQNLNYGSLANMLAGGLIDSVLAGGKKCGYTFGAGISPGHADPPGIADGPRRERLTKRYAQVPPNQFKDQQKRNARAQRP